MKGGTRRPKHCLWGLMLYLFLMSRKLALIKSGFYMPMANRALWMLIFGNTVHLSGRETTLLPGFWYWSPSMFKYSRPESLN